MMEEEGEEGGGVRVGWGDGGGGLRVGCDDGGGGLKVMMEGEV